MEPWTKVSLRIGSILLLVILLLLGACSSDEATSPPASPTTTTTTQELEVSEFNIIQTAVAEYLTDKAGNMKAADLHMKIADNAAPYIVSVRSADDYAVGHIPGAVNVSFADLDMLPENEEILLYCYTGQSASFGAAVLGVLDYDVQNLLHGMSSWSADPDVYKKRFDSETAQGDFQVETEANSAGSYSYPVLDNTSFTGEAAIVEAAAATVSPKYITAADLNMKIADNEDMTILSVRSAEHYAVGHIPGAINIGLGTLADNLNKLDPDAPVYVYCYTGHSAAQAVALLQMLGYDAYSLMFGMCSWTSDTSVNMDKCFKAASVGGYAVEQ
ncbi:rhodanese-like domain-containing protein [Chloroflexota bacterium]